MKIEGKMKENLKVMNFFKIHLKVYGNYGLYHRSPMLKMKKEEKRMTCLVVCVIWRNDST